MKEGEGGFASSYHQLAFPVAEEGGLPSVPAWVTSTSLMHFLLHFLLEEWWGTAPLHVPPHGL